MFKLAIIISPTHNERDEVIALARSHIGFPAYIDVNNDFSKINRHIPQQRSFHTFLMDDGEPSWLLECYKTITTTGSFTDKVRFCADCREISGAKGLDYGGKGKCIPTTNPDIQ